MQKVESSRLNDMVIIEKANIQTNKYKKVIFTKNNIPRAFINNKHGNYVAYPASCRSKIET